MRVDEIMTDNVVTVEDTASVAEAVELLGTLDIRHLPVTSGGELVGMLSDRDLRAAGLQPIVDDVDLERIRALQDQPVSEVMSSDVVSVDPATELSEVIGLMLSEKIGAVPVVDEHDSEIVGIVSYLDLLRAAAPVL